ncbi:expressed unknown protein [Seminavis robusta]|uniref:Uncharacterized protein n=1 Tax=Seminavis robusta TaxID=568900 RepID=A0A9N8HND2_9STRA|nr:expressed unknown protein [Seminavis robusta]|eukprot:Sro811_g205900.1 n/a (324) ;mRNA; f:13233-14451
MLRRSTVVLALGMLAHMALAQPPEYIEWIIDDRCPEDGDRRLKVDEKDSAAHLRGSPLVEGEIQDNELVGKLVEEQNEKPTDHKEGRSLQSFSTNPLTFNLKLHWQEAYCWQREWIERKWCLECPGESCTSGSFLWINECDSGNPLQRFEWVQLGLDGTTLENQGLLKPADYDLCVHQIVKGTFRLLPCNEYYVDQKLVGFDTTNRFELRPARLSHSEDCLTQDHHPKPREELISMSCYIARRHRTSYWEVYEPSEASLSLRVPQCSSGNPCGPCEGDCREDSDCRGDLQCFQRGPDNVEDPVPGCAGATQTHYADYCYDPTR